MRIFIESITCFAKVVLLVAVGFLNLSGTAFAAQAPDAPLKTTPYFQAHYLLAQQGDTPGYGGNGPGPTTNPTIGLNPATTDKTTNNLTSAIPICTLLPAEYRPDCLRQAFARAARASNGNSAYSKVRKHLTAAKKQMDRIIIPNIDTSKPVIRQNGTTYRPVKKAALKKVNRAAVKVIAETETKLLRSSSNSASRKVHYAKIAQAVGSTKVLMRS